MDVARNLLTPPPCPLRPRPAPPPLPVPSQVRLAERYERYWGRGGAASLCVTRAMQAELQRPTWRVPATVFYDRPPDFFRPTTLQARLWSTAVELAPIRQLPAPPRVALPYLLLHFKLTTCWCKHSYTRTRTWHALCRRSTRCCSSCSRCWRRRCTRTTLWPSCAPSWRRGRRSAQRSSSRAAAAVCARCRGAPPWWSAAPAGRPTKTLGCCCGRQR